VLMLTSCLYSRLPASLLDPDMAGERVKAVSNDMTQRIQDVRSGGHNFFLGVHLNPLSTAVKRSLSLSGF
jgi:hypothetical protein